MDVNTDVFVDNCHLLQEINSNEVSNFVSESMRRFSQAVRTQEIRSSNIEVKKTTEGIVSTKLRCKRNQKQLAEKGLSTTSEKSANNCIEIVHEHQPENDPTLKSLLSIRNAERHKVLSTLIKSEEFGDDISETMQNDNGAYVRHILSSKQSLESEDQSSLPTPSTGIGGGCLGKLPMVKEESYEVGETIFTTTETSATGNGLDLKNEAYDSGIDDIGNTTTSVHIHSRLSHSLDSMNMSLPDADNSWRSVTEYGINSIYRNRTTTDTNGHSAMDIPDCEVNNNAQSTSIYQYQRNEQQRHDIEQQYECDSPNLDSDIEILEEVDAPPKLTPQTALQSTSTNDSCFPSNVPDKFLSQSTAARINTTFQHSSTKDANINAFTKTPFIQTKNGFVIFSAETRSKVALENPGSDFSTLSKIVGMNWRKLSNAQKRQYNSRAKALCEANANAEREKMEKMLKRNEIFIFTCGWGNACNYQFDSVEELIEHTKLHANGRSASGLYPCLWRTCLKYRTDKQFTTPNKLLQHIRAKHAYSKSARKIISLSERNRNRNNSLYDHSLPENNEHGKSLTEKQPQKQHSELRDDRNMPKTMPYSFIQTVNNLSAQQGPEGLQAPYLLVIPMNHFSFPNMSFPSFMHQQQQSAENSQFPLIQFNPVELTNQLAQKTTSSSASTPSIVPLYRCSICRAEFSSDADADAHLKTAHAHLPITKNGQPNTDDDDIIVLPNNKPDEENMTKIVVD